MIIKGAEGNDVNTNDYSDVNAMVMEKSRELEEWFVKLKVPFTLSYYTHDHRVGGSFAFVHPTLKLGEANEKLILWRAAQLMENIVPGHRVILVPDSQFLPSDTIRARPDGLPPIKPIVDRGRPTDQ